METFAKVFWQFSTLILTRNMSQIYISNMSKTFAVYSQIIIFFKNKIPKSLRKVLFFCFSQQWLWPTNHINFSFFIRIIKYCLKYYACESCVLINISWMKSGKTVVNCYVCPKKHLFWVGKCALKDHVYKQGKTILKVLIENLISF